MTEAGNKRSRDDAEGIPVQAEQEGDTKYTKAEPADHSMYGCRRRGKMEREAIMAWPA